MTRRELICAFAVDSAAYLEEANGEYHLFHEGQTSRVRRDAARWLLKRLGKSIRSYQAEGNRRFKYVPGDLGESLFSAFVCGDHLESLSRDKLVEAVVEDAHRSVELIIRERLTALPEPVFTELVAEASRRAEELLNPKRKPRRSHRVSGNS